MPRRSRLKPFHPVQMRLDFGQKNVGVTRCALCSMVYAISDEDDIRMHTAFHQKMTTLRVKLPRGVHQHILEEHLNGSRIAELILSDRLGAVHFSRIADVMSRDLGSDIPSGEFRSFATTGDSSIPEDWRVFAYIKDGDQQVIGCCVVQQLTMPYVSSKGYHVRPLVGGLASLLTWRVENIENRSSQNNQMVSYPETQLETSVDFSILCGIRRLWVDRRHRRKGVATRLLDCVLSNLIHGHPLKRSQTAFCDITADGANFAAKYLGHENFLIF